MRKQAVRKALDLTSWEAAQQLAREMELGIVRAEPIRVSDATRLFLEDVQARQLSRESVKKYKALTKALGSYADHRGFRYLSQFDLQALRDFRATWTGKAITNRKKLERLRSLLRFAVHSKWIDENPAVHIKPPKVTDPPTLPIEPDDVTKMLDACEKYPSGGRFLSQTPKRLKALILLMRYSGLRIGDAACLAVHCVADDRVLLYTQKTNVPVYCPLPQTVVDALGDFDPVGKGHFFWNGASDRRSITGNWQRRLKRVFALAGLKGHPHQLRDTFAVELLKKNVSLETVSILLGHSSVKITEKHYRPWVRSLQVKLEEDVRRAWTSAA